VQLGDYATVDRNVISVVNADTFWIEAHSEETQLDREAAQQRGHPDEQRLLLDSDRGAASAAAARMRRRTPLRHPWSSVKGARAGGHGGFLRCAT
jgi:hypothetical protein